MGYTNYWSIIYKNDTLPDEFIDKVKELIKYYKQTYNIDNNLKLFCELSCSSISCNPIFYIIDTVIKQPYTNDTKEYLIKLIDDVKIFLICMVEYFISIHPDIKSLIQTTDIKEIINNIPQYPLPNYNNQDILKKQFNKDNFTSYIYFFFSTNGVKKSYDEIDKIYYNEFLKFNGTINEFLKKQIDISDDKINQFKRYNDLFMLNDPFKYINNYDKTEFNLNYILIKEIIEKYPDISTDYVNNLIDNHTKDIYNIISYTYYLLKNTYWTFDKDKQHYIRIIELNNKNINIKSCYESFGTNDNFCKTARYGYDSLVKTFIILCGYYKVFDKWWNTDDNYELKVRLPEIQEYLNHIGFKIDKLYDSDNEYGYYGIKEEIEEIDDEKEGIFTEISKI